MTFFLTFRTILAEFVVLTLPWDMHIPKSGFLAYHQSNVRGVCGRQGHQQCKLLPLPTQMTFSPISSFLDIRCAAAARAGWGRDVLYQINEIRGLCLLFHVPKISCFGFCQNFITDRKLFVRDYATYWEL